MASVWLFHVQQLHPGEFQHAYHSDPAAYLTPPQTVPFGGPCRTTHNDQAAHSDSHQSGSSPSGLFSMMGLAPFIREAKDLAVFWRVLDK
jgi:hypothetical protein